MKPTREPFDASVRAYRDLTSTRGDGDVTRLRVLGLLASRRRRRRAFEVVFLGGLLLSTVPAISAGWKYLKRGSDLSAGNARERSKRPPGTLHAQAPLQASPVASPGPLPEPAVATPLTDKPPLATGAPPALAPSLATRPPPEAAQGELDLYGRAHDAHFHAQDFAKALRLWNQYVIRYPRGTFRPEAQFNRAICLVRLGDKAGARKVLRELLQASGPDHPRHQAEKLLAELR